LNLTNESGRTGEKPFRMRQEPEGREREDRVAAEEPLEIRLGGEPLVVTLRTPGHDRELAAGFLFSEGILSAREDLRSLERSRDPLAYDPDNLVEAWLVPAAQERRTAIEGARREFMSVAACGLCGKARLESIFQRLPPIAPLGLDPELVTRLPARMEEAQELFPSTGGVHAAALFSAAGELLSIYEDVGRHNALDKLVGAALLEASLPWSGKVVVVSARAGFELVQKAMLAGASALVAVGATSSLAIETARRGGLALYAFTRPGRSNRYC
jgi:FdhD protein